MVLQNIHATYLLGRDTPLPDLNLVVNDADVSRNAEYSLVLENVLNDAVDVFSVYPSKAVGRTPVIIRLANPGRLDYETEEGREFALRVKAVQGEPIRGPESGRLWDGSRVKCTK